MHWGNNYFKNNAVRMTTGSRGNLLSLSGMGVTPGVHCRYLPIMCSYDNTKLSKMAVSGVSILETFFIHHYKV